MTQAIISTHEIVNTNELVREAQQKQDKTKSLDFHLRLLWKSGSFQFEAAIKLFETAVYFDCEETIKEIRSDLRKSNPYLWEAYVRSNFKNDV